MNFIFSNFEGRKLPFFKVYITVLAPYPLFPELSFLVISNSRFPGEIIGVPRDPGAGGLFLNNLQYPSSDFE